MMQCRHNDCGGRGFLGKVIFFNVWHLHFGFVWNLDIWDLDFFTKAEQKDG
jgi:hypothetical protein